MHHLLLQMENDKKNSNVITEQTTCLQECYINIIMKNIEIEVMMQIDGSTCIKKK